MSNLLGTVALSAATFSTISDAFKSGMTTMVSDTMGMVAALVPVIIPLLGASIAVAYAIKYVKRIIK
ncbi:MAG: hypothetical protein RSD27_01735 [Ruthenibacterium sp.]